MPQEKPGKTPKRTRAQTSTFEERERGRLVKEKLRKRRTSLKASAEAGPGTTGRYLYRSAQRYLDEAMALNKKTREVRARNRKKAAAKERRKDR